MFFFISDQFCISFRLITPIICLSLSLVSAYFASDNSAVCKNIFSVLFFMLLANKIPFNLNFFFFKSIKNILYFVIFNFYFDWVDFFSIFKSLLSPYYYKIKNVHVFSLLFIFVINILCTFVSSVTKSSLLTFAI